MKVEELVAVYTALIEVADDQEEWDIGDISQRAGLDLQKTEVLLDELEHMGFLERRNGCWYPRVQLGGEGGN